MPNQPAPKQAGQGNATPGLFQKYFQNYSTGGPPLAPSPLPTPLPPTGFGTTPSPPTPQFGSGQPPAPEPAAGGYGDLATIEAGLSSARADDTAIARTDLGGQVTHPSAYGGHPGLGFLRFLGNAETFVNPLTGKVERAEDAYAAVQENDPAELWEQALQDELALIAAQTQTALSQQAGIAGAAGLATSGAFSSDIGALRTASGAAGAQAIMSNKKLSDDAHDAWIDRIELKGQAAEDAAQDWEDREDTHFSQLADYGDNIVNSWGTQLAEDGWITNKKLDNDLFILNTMIADNNVAEGPAKAAIDALISQWERSGMMFVRGVGADPERIEYHGLTGVTSGVHMAPGERFQSATWDVGTFTDSWEDAKWVQPGTKINWS